MRKSFFLCRTGAGSKATRVQPEPKGRVVWNGVALGFQRDIRVKGANGRDGRTLAPGVKCLDHFSARSDVPKTLNLLPLKQEIKAASKADIQEATRKLDMQLII